MLQEVEPNELHIGDEPTLIFFYTPLCGTCAEARKMLDIALEAVSKNVPAFACNLNFAADLARQWKITSVPCLLYFSEGEMKEKVYAFHSASFLFDLLRKIA